ncbi:S-adenosylmethionine:tRNA ribosyltransferase-isomerase [Bacillus sp. CECT 9360]|uniref:S-adenosylmethionine:tRNA ribosyltransferase-isomerase n=1 Tax=Bacillus sp. CECT 9360 TaxID=2845821 RepID=UPI001E5019BB|nr:S-adenosylmethionine:tRNA ribosyltransferase-isomerase [Bacillus sp. CECT 9360]CAH0344715.1 S-adenosylmethionine:tRNA ribosyltransferase-isomerase [Bacillus sp. CECT 9360]
MASIYTLFELPPALHAGTPPERRGIRRDRVRMMTLDRVSGEVDHDLFFHLDQYLNGGDMLVLNNSRTIPAILKATMKRNGVSVHEDVEVRLARRKNEGVWESLIVSDTVKLGDTLHFSYSLCAKVTGVKVNSPLKTLHFSKTGSELFNDIYSLGEPVRYEYIHQPWDLNYYQTVYGTVPGSVEMPSAGRAFSWELLLALQQKGVKIAFLQLHTGLSYLLEDKWHLGPVDQVEQYKIPEETMASILRTKDEGGRVIAVGTTVVRAIESSISSGKLEGSTKLYIDSKYQLKMIDGILTGFHEPEASHLDMLAAFISEDKLICAYQEAIDQGYLWHEFGDMNLII